jgi:acyl CoA:acetate/3-ketoacid CoA transferase beta subunit
MASADPKSEQDRRLGARTGLRAIHSRADPDLTDAAGQPVGLRGASIIDSVTSFAIVRGGHLDLSVLGGLQVSGRGESLS